MLRKIWNATSSAISRIIDPSDKKCRDALKVFGVSGNQISLALNRTNFSDITTDYRERRLAYAGTGAFDSATRAIGSQTIRQFYYEEQSNNRAVHAIAFLNSANDWHGAQVSVDPSYVLGAAESDLAAMLVHETIHTTTGLTADAMDARIEEFSPGFTVKPGQNLKSEFIKSNCLKSRGFTLR